MILIPEKANEIEKKMRLKKKEDTWRRVFDATIVKYKDHIIGDIINARYIKGQTVTYTCAELDITERLYFKYREAALNAFMAGLIQEGVLKLYD